MIYVFKSSALRDLKKLPRPIQKQIIQKLNYYVASGQPLHFAHAIKDHSLGEFRFRISDYRVLFDVDEAHGQMIVLAIGHRKDIYR